MSDQLAEANGAVLSAKRPKTVTVDPTNATSLNIVAIEILVATIWIVLIIVGYFANYFLFGADSLIHGGLWVAVALNTLGTLSAIHSLLGRGSMAGKLPNAVGLVVNAVLLAGGLHVLTALHQSI